MTIFEFQNKVKDALNGVEALVQGGCMAFAEDTRTVYDEANQWISDGKVAVVVTTPRMQRNGDRAGTLPMECTLAIRCLEIAPLASEDTSVIRALDAAEIVGHALDGRQLCLVSIDQTADERTKTITATASFNTTIHLTND